MKENIYHQLKNKIINEEIKPGSILTEREISIEYGLSRTPVREVLWHLISDGLLNKNSSREYSVTVLSLDRIFDIFQSREAVEGMAARMASLKGNEIFLKKINEFAKKIKEIDVDRNPKQHIFYGRQLHDSIITMANNPFLSEFYNKLEDLSALVRNITKNSAYIEKNSQKAHLKIIQALSEKDEEKSEYYMREHLRVTSGFIARFLYPKIFVKTKSKV